MLLDKSKIIMTIDILRCLGNHLSLTDITKDKVVSIKEDFVTIKNITSIIYQKHDKKILLYNFSWPEPIVDLFYL